MATRDLTWDGCLNVRDLGGLPTADGGETRFGSVIRADSVGQLTDEGWEHRWWPQGARQDAVAPAPVAGK